MRILASTAALMSDLAVEGLSPRDWALQVRVARLTGWVPEGRMAGMRVVGVQVALDSLGGF